jgi:hypothetical protein
MDEVIDQHDAQSLRNKTPSDHERNASQRVRNVLRYQRKYLQSVRLRGVAVNERLKNEINLVSSSSARRAPLFLTQDQPQAFNMVAQYDSKVSVAIGISAREDGVAMKTVAFITLIFLPATAIAVCLMT